MVRTDSPEDDPLEAVLGRTVAQLDRARADVALAVRLQERLRDEIELLERRLADSEAERLELLEKVEQRDRLLSQIFGSRSWRLGQTLRHLLGRR